MSSNPEPIVFRVAIDGAEQVAAGANRTSAALAQMGARGAAPAGVAAAGLDKNLFRLSSTLMALSPTIGKLDPAFGGLVSQMGRLGGSGNALISVLGMGTGLGLALTGVTTGIGFLVDQYTTSKEKADEFTKEQKKLNAELNSFQNILKRIKEEDTAKEFWEGMYGGTINPKEAMQKVREMQRTGDKLIAEGRVEAGNKMLADAMVYGRKYNQVIADNKRREIDLIKISNAESVVAGEEDVKNSLKRKTEIIDTYALGNEVEAKIRKINGILETSEYDKSLSDFTQFIKSRENIKKLVEDESEARKSNVLAIEETNRKNSIAAFKFAEDNKLAASAASRDTIIANGRQVQSMAEAGLASGIGSVVKGQKLQIGAILEAAGDQLISMSIIEAFKGGEMLAGIYTAPLAAPHFALAAAELAAGVAMAGGGSSLAGGSNSAGAASAPAIKQSDQINNAATAQESKTPIIINLTTIDGEGLTREINRSNSRNSSVTINSKAIRQ